MVTLILVSFFVAETYSARCDENGHIHCCSGYEWNNMSRKCTKCKPGFFGINCSNACQFPYFGEGCQQECFCSEEEECDKSIGCQLKTTTITTPTIITTAQFYTKGNNVKSSSTTSDHVYITTSINIATSENMTLETRRTKDIKSLDLSGALFSAKNMLLMAAFGVCLVLMTLLIIFSFKVIFRRCSARHKSKRQNKRERAFEMFSEPAPYEEISNVEVLSLEKKYTPLQNSIKVGYNKPFERSIIPQKKQMELIMSDCLEETVTDNENDTSIKFSSVGDPLDSQVTETTDSEGYQLPQSSASNVRKTVKTDIHAAIIGTCNDSNNGYYLTVLPGAFDQKTGN